MTDQELAEAVCEAFESQKLPMTSPDFYEVVAAVVYYECAIRMVKAKPFRPESVQTQVLLFLDKKLGEAVVHMTRRPLDIIRTKINTFKED